VNIEILTCQIIGPASAGSAGPVPTPLWCCFQFFCITIHHDVAMFVVVWQCYYCLLLLLCSVVQLVDDEMFWVATEVCSETNVMKRVRIIKQLVKIASKSRRTFYSASVLSVDEYCKGVLRQAATVVMVIGQW